MWLLAAVVGAILALSATGAMAAPTSPTMSTGALQSLIDLSGGSVDGYLRTVMNGSDIVEIPVRIKAVTSGFASGPPELSALILLEAYGPHIEQPTGVGGIASGMSGSPIYVDDGAVTDTLVGALSYGDMFTLSGYGLATPIDAMAAIEDDYSIAMTGIRTLATPVLVDGKAINSVIISSNPSKIDPKLSRSAFVAKPLVAQYLGGLSPRSKVYQAHKKHLESHGGSLVPVVGGLSSMEHPYDDTFEGGSAIAALAARGDLWYGGIGTVTYVNGDNVLAFGHPAFHSGETGLFMGNAWIDGVWPSSSTPYKLGRPASVRGTITQDRSAGVLGVDGSEPDVAVITAAVHNADTGKVGTSMVELPAHVMNSTSWDFEGLAPVSAYIAATRANDAWQTKGSALVTTKVKVEEGIQQFEIVRTNIVDSSWDISSAAMMDVASIVYELQQLGDNGIAHPTITAVDVDATVTKARRNAEVVDITVTGGLRTGYNTATVSLLQWGVPATQTVDVAFTIPAGVPLTGILMAAGPDGMLSDGDDFEESMYFEGTAPESDRRTLAQAVADLQGEPTNNTVKLAFAPMDIPSELDGELSAALAKSYKTIEASKEVAYVVNGGFLKVAPRVRLKAARYTVSYNSPAALAGELLGTEDASDLSVTRLYAGASAPSKLSTATYDPDEGPFLYMTPRLTKNAKLTFSFAGDKDTLPASASTTIKVKARTTLSPSRTRFSRGKTTTLRSYVAPSTAKGKVVFERYRSGSWRSIGSRTVVGGKASMSYKPRRAGTYKIRARFVAASGSTNVSSTSAIRKLTVTR